MLDIWLVEVENVDIALVYLIQTLQHNYLNMLFLTKIFSPKQLTDNGNRLPM